LTIKLTQHVVPIRPFPRGCLLVLRKLAFPQIAPPAIPRSAHLFLSVLARTPAGYSSRICSFPTRKPATQPPLLVPQGAVRACRSSECQPIQLSKNLHPEPVRAPSARGTATGGRGHCRGFVFSRLVGLTGSLARTRLPALPKLKNPASSAGSNRQSLAASRVARLLSTLYS